MSSGESEALTEADAGSAPPAPATPLALAEHEADATPMGYGDGRVPWYLVALWAAAVVGLAAYAVRFLVPDLSAWVAP
jgi:hypothetical protein